MEESASTIPDALPSDLYQDLRFVLEPLAIFLNRFARYVVALRQRYNVDTRNYACIVVKSCRSKDNCHQRANISR